MSLPELRHLSREDAAIFVHPRPFVVISITDPGSVPAEFVPCEHRRAVLRMEFHDLDAVPDGLNGKDLVIYGREHARRVLEFVEEHRSVDLILIHCEAGLSRSAGLAAAIAMRLLSRTYRPRKGIPNRRVYLETVRLELR